MATEIACKGLRGEIPIYQNAKTMIQIAEKFVYILITPEIAKNENQFSQIILYLITKKKEMPDIQLKLVISYVPENRILIDQAIGIGIEIYQWKFGTITPFGKILTEKGMIITILNKINPSPQYNLGYQKSHFDRQELMGFQHEFLWIIDHLSTKLT